MIKVSILIGRKRRVVKLYRYNKIAYWLNLLSFLFSSCAEPLWKAR
jgi:hypothetical protein